MTASRRVLKRVLDDCRPALVAIQGRSGFDTFCEVADNRVRVGTLISQGGSAGTYQWAAYHAQLQDRDVVIVQLPHFSRANSAARLNECSLWLSAVLRSAGVSS